jgi:hypothetical protein
MLAVVCLDVEKSTKLSACQTLAEGKTLQDAKSAVQT